MKFSNLIVSALALSAGLSVSADVFKVDDVYYKVLSETDKTVAITKKAVGEYAGDIEIPQYVTNDAGDKFKVVEVGDSAFLSSTYLESVILPNEITKFGRHAFGNCGALTSLNFPDELDSIKAYALCDCKQLATLDLPDKLTYIGEKGCYQIKATKELTLPASLKMVYYNAFSYCGFNTVNIGAGATTFEYMCFDPLGALKRVNIVNLENLLNSKFVSALANPLSMTQNIYLNDEPLINLVVPEGATQVPGNCFRDYAKLETVDLPSTTTLVAGSSFLGCTGLKTFICRAVTPPETTNNTWSAAVCETLKVYVPDESVELYKDEYGWAKLQNILPLSTFGDDAGIYDIFVDNNAAKDVYYNLQGVQVANPSNGIFLRRHGNKVTKVIK